MMKKMAKVLMIILMVLGILFSISNFMSEDISASRGTGEKGVWDDRGECMSFGDDCEIPL